MSAVPSHQAGIDISAEELIALRHRARNLQLAARRPVASVLAGVHTSRFRGRGVDFLESRHYQPGDDIRNIDWRVTARTGKPHTKVFHEERERPVITLLDLSPSMFFGSRVRLKSVQAAHLAGLIAWAAVRRGDRVGGLISAGEQHYEVKPAGGRRGAMRLIGRLVQAGQEFTVSRFDAGYQSLTPAIKRLRRVARPGSLVFLISDLLGLDDSSEKPLSRLAAHCDVLAVEVSDALEWTPPPPASYAVSDGDASVEVDLRSAPRRQRYLRDLKQQRQEGRAMLARNGITVLQCQTDQSAFDTLARAFGQTRGA